MSGKRLAQAVRMRGCCCASKITIAPAAVRSSRLRCSRISHGSDLHADGELTQTERAERPVRAGTRRSARARTDVRVRVLAHRHRRRGRYPGTCRDKDLPEAAGLGVRVQAGFDESSGSTISAWDRRSSALRSNAATCSSAIDMATGRISSRSSSTTGSRA